MQWALIHYLLDELINELWVFNYRTIHVSLEIRKFDFCHHKTVVLSLIGMMTMIMEKLISYLNEA